MQTTRTALAAMLALVLPLVGGCDLLALLTAGATSPEPSISPPADVRTVDIPPGYDGPLGEPPAYTTPLHEGPLPGWPRAADGIVLRVDINEGYHGSEIISVDARGWVVRAAQTDVYSSTDDYTTWRLSRRGLRRLLTTVDRSGLRQAPPRALGDDGVSPASRAVSFRFGDGTSRASSMPGYGERLAPRTRDLRRRLWRLAERVADAGRPDGAHIAVPPRPWVPDRLGIMAGGPSTRSGMAPGHPPYRQWPLDRSIRELSTGTRPNPYDEPEHAFCLTGRDAAAVFALMTGINHAYLRVDDGRRWELNVHVTLPAYELLDSPCA